MSAPRCTYDTGSMFGNVPVCDARAMWDVTYEIGSGGPLVESVCERHVGPTRGRVFPGEVSTVRRESARVTDLDGWPVGTHGPGLPPGTDRASLAAMPLGARPCVRCGVPVTAGYETSAGGVSHLVGECVG